MSGGVDSAVTAALLQQRGFQVIGVTLVLYAYGEELAANESHKKHCHPLSFVESAQRVADQLGIAHQVIHQEELFRSKVIDPFMEAYAKGKTPLPCVGCNREVKTEILYRVMEKVGAQAIATGHYVRRIEVEGEVQLHQGKDRHRDQSFFLFALSPHQVERIHFPLGNFSKEETRSKAKAFGLAVADSPASQDLCFISKRSYKTLFSPLPGDIVHVEGHAVGKHQGIHGYTLGQRKNLGVGGQGNPLYVVGLDPEQNRVIVGPYEALARKKLCVENVNWLVPIPQEEFRIQVKIRSSGEMLQAKAVLQNKKVFICLEQPEYGVAPGQACVFYQGTRLLGGGWISA